MQTNPWILILDYGRLGSASNVQHNHRPCRASHPVVLPPSCCVMRGCGHGRTKVQYSRHLDPFPSLSCRKAGFTTCRFVTCFLRDCVTCMYCRYVGTYVLWLAPQPCTRAPHSSGRHACLLACSKGTAQPCTSCVSCDAS